MQNARWARSIVTRLVGGLCLIGMAFSIGMAIFEFHRSTHMAEVETTGRMTRIVSDVRFALESLITENANPKRAKIIEQTLDNFTERDPLIVALGLHASDGQTYKSGYFPSSIDTMQHWSISESGVPQDGELDVDKKTLLISEISHAGTTYTLHLLIDGPLLRERMNESVVQQLSGIWIMMGGITLIALLLLRRWLTRPLHRLDNLIREDASASVFEETADDMKDEFGDLARAIAGMLNRLDKANCKLRQREGALQHLYHFAPTAMVSINVEGTIVEANRRATELFGYVETDELIGCDVLQCIRSQDRGVLRQCVERSSVNHVHQCQVVIHKGRDEIDVNVELATVLDELGEVSHIRLSFNDVSESKRLIHQVTEQQRLLDLVVNHMSDAILLVAENGRIITSNNRLEQLLHLHVSDIIGDFFDHREFWSRLEIRNPAAFDTRMEQVLQQIDQSVSEQFETRHGAFLFQVIPICDEPGNLVARLWVVQDVTEQMKNRNLLEQQAAQLRALQHVGYSLHLLHDVDVLMERTVMELLNVLDVEAVGVALRHENPEHRSCQAFDLGVWQTDQEDKESLMDAVRTRLMPNILPTRSTSYWTDLSQHGRWTDAFKNVGLDSLAATALYNRNETQGLIWIARRGGRPIERRHLFMLEALAPLISTGLTNAQMRQQMYDLNISSSKTDLPTESQLQTRIARHVQNPAQPWSLLIVELDHVEKLRDRYGQSVIDQYLRAVADRFRDVCRIGDDIIHMDDDRFVIISPAIRLYEAIPMAKRIRQHVQQLRLTIDDHTIIQATCCIGAAGSPNDHFGEQLTYDVALERLRKAQAVGSGQIEPATTIHAPAPKLTPPPTKNSS